MSKLYTSPEIEFKKYRMSQSVFTSDPGLHDGDDYELDDVNDPVDDLFAE